MENVSGVVLGANMTDTTGEPATHIHTPLFFISEETYEQFAFVSSSVLSPCICLFGLVGNSLGLGVLWKDTQQVRLSIYTYLYCLTLIDSLYLGLGLVRNIPQLIKTGDQQLANFVDEHMKLGTIYLDMVTAHTSRAILIVMSLERLVALVRPFEVKHFVLTKYPRKVVAMCVLFNLVFLLPFPLFLEVESFSIGNHTEYFVQFRPDMSRAMETYMIVQTVVDYILPCTVLLFTNTAILLTYSSILRRRLVIFNIDPSRVYHQKGKVTATVFFISLLFLLCSLPNLFIKILAFVDSEYNFAGHHKVVFWFFIDLSNLFEYINAANDSVIYILVSNHYRQIFTDLYCRCCGRGRQDSDSPLTVPSPSDRRSDTRSRY